MSRCCSIACYVLFSVLFFLPGILLCRLAGVSHLFPLCSLQLNHVQVVEGHQMPVTAEDIHVALGVNDADVSVTGCWFCAADQTEFVFV